MELIPGALQGERPRKFHDVAAYPSDSGDERRGIDGNSQSVLTRGPTVARAAAPLARAL